ncbi:threonine ammonia-lyase [Planctomycetota bacterium]|nr:threonine ammonia-lyase [Planctomycetota bacterium]
MVSFESVKEARDRIGDHVQFTPCRESYYLSELTGCRVFCKREYLQRTGSFKERGAANALGKLGEVGKERGVVAASAGNHALALAYHGKRLGIPVTVVMPKFAPLIKVSTCRRFGATVILAGESFGEARKQADALVEQKGMVYVHGYDDPDVIAGQGTIGLELLEQVSDVDAVVVPIGGAGLIAGIGLVVKALKPEVEVIGVEPERVASYRAAMKAGRPIMIESEPTLADGLAVGCVGDCAFEIAQKCVDRVVTVTEGELSLAVLRLLELEKAVVEGSGAAGLAALLGPLKGELEGKNVVLPLCGGNLDPFTLHRVIEHGMTADGRLHALEIRISDRPGGLARLTELLGEGGVSIQCIDHDRMFAGPDVACVCVRVVLETRDMLHYQDVLSMLDDCGLEVNKSN